MIIIYLLFTSILLAFISINYICEKIYDRIIYLKRCKVGLSDDSELDMINKTSMPFIYQRSSDEAVVLIHGMCHTPNHFNSVFNHLKKNTSFDIYAPLLKYHGRKLEDQCKAKISEITEQLEKDIDHVIKTKKYKKVYCIGHSFGSVLLINLSIYNKLPQHVNLILYAVPLALIAPFYISIPLLFITRFINKYLFFVNFYGVDQNRGKKFAYNSPYYIPSTHLAFTISRFCFKVRQMLKNGMNILNKFCYINIRDDRIVNSKVSAEILDEQIHKQDGVILDQGSHSIHMNKKHNKTFFENIDSFLNTLRGSF